MVIGINRINWRFLALIILFLTEGAFAQPYILYMNGGSDDAADIYRLDLSTGVSEFFVGGIWKCQGIVVDPTDQWAYISWGRGGSYLDIVNINDTSKAFEPLSSESEAGAVSGFAGVIYVPQANKFYVTWLKGDSGSETTIYDAMTFKRLGDIDFGFSFSDMVSPDGQYIYQYASDSLGNTELYTFSTSTNSVVSTKPLSNVGPDTPDKGIEAGANGRFLLSWMHTEDNSSLNYYYSVYDIPTESNLPSIDFPLICDAYLSADGDYIILNRWGWIDTIGNTGQQFYPGTVYVFDANTGELTQRLSLPPGGKILVIRNYPKMFYYYNDSTNQSVAISDTVVTPTGVLIDTLISLKHQAVANGWLKEGMGHRGDIDEIIRGRGWYNEGHFKQYEKWHPDESWDFDHDWNNGIVKVLDKRLDMAKRALDHRDSVMARRNLEIFVMEVEMLNNLSEKIVKRGEEAIITSQGYLSLKFNAEYLIDRLPARHKREQR